MGMGPLKAAVSLLLYAGATVVVFVLLLPLALLKALLPPCRSRIGRWADALDSGWIQSSNMHQSWLTGTDIQVEGDLPPLRRNQWYMRICKHQSLVDIMILMKIFNGRIPYVKFFFKKQL